MDFVVHGQMPFKQPRHRNVLVWVHAQASIRYQIPFPAFRGCLHSVQKTPVLTLQEMPSAMQDGSRTQSPGED